MQAASGLGVTEHTGPLAPSILRRYSPVVASHRRTAPSCPPAASPLPSGLKARDFTSLLPVWSVSSRAPVAASSKRTSLAEATARKAPLGFTATAVQPGHDPDRAAPFPARGVHDLVDLVSRNHPVFGIAGLRRRQHDPVLV